MQQILVCSSTSNSINVKPAFDSCVQQEKTLWSVLEKRVSTVTASIGDTISIAVPDFIPSSVEYATGTMVGNSNGLEASRVYCV